MVKMTLSFRHWCWTFHREIYLPLMFGHIEELTDDLRQEYIDWCNTDEGKRYLKSGRRPGMNDCINREDAVIEIERFGGYLDDDMLYRIKLALGRLPSADVVEVRHGRWIGKTYKCSLCGKWVDPLQGDADMNYCPNCGAKMDGKEQEHE